MSINNPTIALTLKISVLYLLYVILTIAMKNISFSLLLIERGEDP